MSITPPAASVLKARYPEYGVVSDDLIDLILAEAALFVASSWASQDQQPALLALAAHMLAMEGEPQRSDGAAGGSSAVAGPVSSAKVGDVAVTFKGWSASSTAGTGPLAATYMETAYGQRFLQYLRRNFPAVRTV